MDNMKRVNGYEVVEEIYKGAFCDTYKALKKGKVFFLKVYKDPTQCSTDFDAFVENQKIIKSLLHQLGDMAEDIIEDFVLVEEGRYYQVKNFIQGQSLRDWMYDNGDFYQRLDIAIQLCECVRAVHDKDIIMQDLKPENIMLVPNLSKKSEVRIVLVDFDWAVPNGKVVRYVSTPGYSHIDGKKMSYKSDIFTLGIVLSELLTGANPYIYDGRTWEYDLWERWIKEKDYTAPVKINEELPMEINDIIEQCLDSDPDKRPTADEILIVLKKIDINETEHHPQIIEKKDKYKYFADFVFCLDCSCSMLNVLDSIKENIVCFLEGIDTGEYRINWRVRVMGYRNFEVDDEYLMNDNPFVSSVKELKKQLDGMEAKGYAGNGPCSTLDAIWYAAKQSEWRNLCHKFVIVFTDAYTLPINEKTCADILGSDFDLDILFHSLVEDHIKLMLYGLEDPVYDELRIIPHSDIVQFKDPIEFYYHKTVDLSPILDIIGYKTELELDTDDIL